MTSTRLFAIAFCSAIALAACGGSGTGSGGTQSSSAMSEMSSEVASASTGDMIHVTAPMPNQVVTSPLIVQGSARGSWYFEATFPVELLDGNGNVIAQFHAQAGGNWMTNDFVPFTTALVFNPPATPNGTLVLKKDNPSGMPEHDASIEIPVLFQ